ncbi:MAG: DUF4199 domain-containing protein [Verrucomicrobiota bacterium]
MMKSLELRWGLIIGGANMLWLFGSYYLGMHDRGLAAIQAITLVSVMISVMGYMLAIRALMQDYPETQYLEGIRYGAIIAGIVASIADLSQVIYFKVVNPGWTAKMVEMSRLYYLQQGLPETQAEEYSKAAEKTFGLPSYLLQASLGAIIIGVLSTAIILLIFRKSRKA